MLTVYIYNNPFQCLITSSWESSSIFIDWHSQVPAEDIYDIFIFSRYNRCFGCVGHSSHYTSHFEYTMPKSKMSKSKKKMDNASEPPHDPGWERVGLTRATTRLPSDLQPASRRPHPETFRWRSPPSSLMFSRSQAVKDKRWNRPVEALPDASKWPTWGALRERILTNAEEVCFALSSTHCVTLSPVCTGWQYSDVTMHRRFAWRIQILLTTGSLQTW